MKMSRLIHIYSSQEKMQKSNDQLNIRLHNSGAIWFPREKGYLFQCSMSNKEIPADCSETIKKTIYNGIYINTSWSRNDMCTPSNFLFGSFVHPAQLKDLSDLSLDKLCIQRLTVQFPGAFLLLGSKKKAQKPSRSDPLKCSRQLLGSCIKNAIQPLWGSVCQRQFLLFSIFNLNFGVSKIVDRL